MLCTCTTFVHVHVYVNVHVYVYVHVYVNVCTHSVDVADAKGAVCSIMWSIRPMTAIALVARLV